MFEISLDGVKKYMDTTLVLKNITFQITDGEKVGIVGENGSGKTTILKLIAGILTLHHCAGYPYAPVPPGYDEGWVNTPKNAVISYLEQIPQYAESIRVIDVLNLAFNEVQQIEDNMHQLEKSMQTLSGIALDRTLKKYSELVQLYEIKGGYDTEEKLNRICKGLHFNDDFLNQNFNLLSGGEKTTVILGKLLIDNPDILLLDEPTNHLDIESVEWLEGYLKSYKGIVIVVSHDRYFLDNVVSKIIEVEDKECDTYKGNYTDYAAQKNEKIRIQLEDYKEQRKKINDMEQSIKELRDWAARADNNKFFRRAASMQIKLDKMDRVEKPNEKQNMKFHFQTSERSGKITIKAENISKSFENKIIFNHADLLVHYGERISLIGPNGCGKTTFIKMLLGEEQPDEGTVSLGASVRTAYLPQSISFEDEDLTVIDYFRKDISILEGKAREYLSKFMFYGANVFKKLKVLSGGERVRLKLGILLFEDINLLILDEPTNHLDTESIESIEEALENFKGTIFFISHDRYFINKISQRVIAIEHNAFKSYAGNYDYYKSEKDKLYQENIIIPKEQHIDQINDNTKSVKKVSKANPKSTLSDDRSNAKKNEIEINKVERMIKELENDLQDINSTMEACGSNYEELNRLYTIKEELSKKLDTNMELWLSLQNTLPVT